MRHAFLLVTIGLLAVAACTSPISSPTARLDGNWGTVPVVPSGSGIDLSLATNGPIVMGTGHQYAIVHLKYSFTITGLQSSDGTTFSLTLTSDSGTVATYSGRMVGSDELRGEWEPAPCSPATGCHPASLTFVRQPQ